ncbi:unnamed protein product [Rodentolepis nana]|uniref:Uncharacterized protein n=1 Tax=Rodentolepis nana TaxID=102285 RepID=A0A0R3TUI4_RODNA|nr:unnamed protein product [Rodentolepis nana]
MPHQSSGTPHDNASNIPRNDVQVLPPNVNTNLNNPRYVTFFLI